MKKKIIPCLHGLLMIAAAALIAVSSSMAYSLSDLNLILIFAGVALALDVVMLIFLPQNSVFRDMAMLLTVVLASLALCRVLIGRADLMGYVWFSDLEKENPTAVTSLNLAVASMFCFLLGVIIMIVTGFRKAK